MTNLPLQTLERAKYTPDSDESESTVRTSVVGGEVGDDQSTIYRDNQRHHEVLNRLDRIIELLEHLNYNIDDAVF